MRKQISIYLILLFFLSACEKEDVISEPPAKQEEISLGEKTAEENVSDGESSDPEYEEYFIAQFGADDFIIEEPDQMYAQLRFNPDTGNTALFVEAYTKDGKEDFFFQVCFYDGVGTYNTGAGNGNEYCYYFTEYGVWFSDGPMEKIGVIDITEANSEFIKGEFEIFGYNEDHPENSMDFIGEYGLIID